MENLLNKGYCERAPHLENEECWYLPLFGVYHPKKKDKIRIVFDSSSKFDGVSLNSVLMTGPDLTNSLTGILMRFRRDRIAVSGDIEQMFYQFRVDETHRNYLRFLWYEDNDFNKPLIEYRMCVHVFGNAPSPAVATYGLQQSAKNAAETYGEAMLDFVCNDFYVDDGLSSLHTEREAVSLLTNTKEALQEEGNLREEDLAKDIKSKDSPVHRSLGLTWRLDDDSFTFQLDRDEKPTYTKRTVLGIINSLYDPLGFLSPFTITGKLLLRDITDSVQDWDEPLPDYLHKKWLSWFQSLQDLQYLRIPRTYFPPSVKFGAEKELHVFCDASEKAISNVAYLKTVGNESTNVGYVFGKAKVAPKHGHTIPRLELCAAVLGVEIAEMICEELSISPENITYHTDSKIVLGYLNNKTRRFYVYVENRVSRILKFSKSLQWKYVETDRNPADESTRGLKPSELVHSKWLSGLPLLSLPESSEQYDLQNPNEDVEVRSSVTSMKTEVKFGINRFEKFSTWKRLVLAISTLLKFVRRFKKRHTSSSDNCQSQILPEQEIDAKTFIIKQVQKEIYHKEISCLKSDKKLPKQSNVLDLAPFINKNEEILRVGGRLKSSQLPKGEKHPILIPGRSHTATLLVRHYHEKVHHQGRHITEGAIRTAGYWITGGKRLIANLIHSCVQCRKLRGSFSSQMMSNLPADRITPAPPFTFVGVDVFGPWNVITRRTRGGSSTSKRWAVLFTCLSIRAIHIELVEEMSSSAFINALRRLLH
ncbi:uncharacterized protein LOC132755319 [Ruditapes philippinarum]|uniref:uncharacterized protein LOC132755319 n=1 Tax=Ruditapes philippinarum TaxID=129788 RepID=UPI00295BBA28|nr:uncharacterized protein LOC132755319 [Ruditapes philippinarum]